MSRTNKGSKPPGYDFWSRRPKSSKNSKDLTHRAERQEGKEEVAKAVKEVMDGIGDMSIEDLEKIIRKNQEDFS